MYSFMSRVRFSETDGSGNLSITGLVNYLQDCATLHSNDIGLTVEKLCLHGAVWVLANWQIEITRMPHLGESIRVSTYPNKVKGFAGHRDFLIETDGGERLAAARSAWSVVEPKTGKLTRLPDEFCKLYGEDPMVDMTAMERKIRPEGELNMTFAPFQVLPHMVDTNGHMNNSQYVTTAADCLPADFAVRRLRVEYKLPAYRGNTLTPMGCMEEERVTIALTGERGQVHAMLEFSK